MYGNAKLFPKTVYTYLCTVPNIYLAYLKEQQ